jgi:hypothetical protein
MDNEFICGYYIQDPQDYSHVSDSYWPGSSPNSTHCLGLVEWFNESHHWTLFKGKASTLVPIGKGIWVRAPFKNQVFLDRYIALRFLYG